MEDMRASDIQLADVLNFVGDSILIRLPGDVIVHYYLTAQRAGEADAVFKTKAERKDPYTWGSILK